jgi:hypothetical protein
MANHFATFFITEDKNVNTNFLLQCYGNAC